VAAADGQSDEFVRDASRRVGRSASPGLPGRQDPAAKRPSIRQDLHAMLVAHGDWMPIGGTDEQKPAPDGTVEAWGRDPGNPVGGWYGLKKGLRGRFGVYLPPLLEALGLVELEHNARNNRVRALPSAT